MKYSVNSVSGFKRVRCLSEIILRYPPGFHSFVPLMTGAGHWTLPNRAPPIPPNYPQRNALFAAGRSGVALLTKDQRRGSVPPSKPDLRQTKIVFFSSSSGPTQERPLTSDCAANALTSPSEGTACASPLLGTPGPCQLQPALPPSCLLQSANLLI